MSAFQETADRVSAKLQELYDSMDEQEKGVLEGILTAANASAPAATRTRNISVPGVAALDKVVQTPVTVRFKTGPDVELPVLVLCW